MGGASQVQLSVDAVYSQYDAGCVGRYIGAGCDDFVDADLGKEFLGRECGVDGAV